MQNSNIDFTAKAVTLSKLLSYAILDLFPEVQLWQGFAEGSHFCYQFYGNFSFDSSSLELIENQMIFLKNKGFEPYLMEMIPKNAIDLFESQGQYKLKDIILSSENPLVRVLRLDDRYDLVQSSIDKDIEKTHFKLTHFECEETPDGKKVTIFGLGAPSANDLKQETKVFKERQKWGHLEKGERLNLFKQKENQWIFYPMGQLLLDQLKKQVEKVYSQNGVEKVSFINTPLLESFKGLPSKYFFMSQEPIFSKNPLNQGLFKLEKGSFDQWAIYAHPKELFKECISCLKFYLQIIKILGFSTQIKLRAPKGSELIEIVEKSLKELSLEFELVAHNKVEVQFDIVGPDNRVHLSPSWTLEKKEKGFLFKGSFCSSYEKLLALFIEVHKEKWPENFQSSQLKIIPLEKGEDFAKEVYDYFKKNNINASIDRSNEKLSIRLKKAYLEKVPRIAIVGEKEQKEEMLTVKIEQLKEELKCSKETLLEQMLEELIER